MNDTHTHLSVESRLCLFYDCGAEIHSILSLDDTEITTEFISVNKIPPENILAAGLFPCALFARGCKDVSSLRNLGFDSLHLRNEAFVTQSIACYGSSNVCDAFVSTASDAVSISGSEAVTMLGLSTNALLKLCAGNPLAAKAVLLSIPESSRLRGVEIVSLLDTGIDSLIDSWHHTAYHCGKHAIIFERSQGSWIFNQYMLILSLYISHHGTVKKEKTYILCISTVKHTNVTFHTDLIIPERDAVCFHGMWRTPCRGIASS